MQRQHRRRDRRPAGWRATAARPDRRRTVRTRAGSTAPVAAGRQHARAPTPRARRRCPRRARRRRPGRHTAGAFDARRHPAGVAGARRHPAEGIGARRDRAVRMVGDEHGAGVVDTDPVVRDRAELHRPRARRGGDLEQGDRQRHGEPLGRDADDVERLVQAVHRRPEHLGREVSLRTSTDPEHRGEVTATPCGPVGHPPREGGRVCRTAPPLSSFRRRHGTSVAETSRASRPDHRSCGRDRSPTT